MKTSSLTDSQHSRALRFTFSSNVPNNTHQAKRPLPALPTISSNHQSTSQSYHHPYPEENPSRSTNQIRNQLPYHFSSHSTQSVSHETPQRSIQQSYPDQSNPLSPRRDLPNLPRPNPQPFNQIPFNQTQDVNQITIPNRIIRTGSLQGSRPLPNLDKQFISTHQTLISNPSRPLPTPPSANQSKPQPTLTHHQELQPVLMNSIKPFTSPSNPTSEPPSIAISSVPELTVTPTIPIPVSSIVGIEEESLNESKPIITFDSTSEPNLRSVPVPVPMIVTEEDGSSPNSESNSSSFNEISIQVPSILTETSSNQTQTYKPEPISSSSSNQTQTNTFQSLFCGGCNQIIAGRIVNALNKRWHPDCFKCEHCQMVLEHVAFYEHLGKAYCGVDYDEFFSLKCHHCNTSITDESYVTLDEPSLINGPRHYHQLHLFCAECGEPFLNPKSLEEFSKISKLKNHQILNQHHQIEFKKKIIEPNPFVLHKGYPYCESCHLRLHKPKCFGCKLSMVGDFINAMGKQWHENCFLCKGCKNQFLNGRFFLDHGDPFCEQCYSVLLKQTF